ncbi:MAG: efflux RND transporter periplasmic adaptor subunit [Thermoanaerobaculia bacterium]
MKRILVRLVLLAAVAAVAFYYWHKRSAEKEHLVLSGSIEARLVEVGSLVGGRVEEIRIEEGAEVASGDVLVVLEADLLDRQIDGQRAAIAQAKAQSDLANAGPRTEVRARAKIAWEASKTDLGRLEALYKDGVVGRADYDRALVQEATSRKNWEEANGGSRIEDRAAAAAALARQQSDLAYLERQREELTVRAPAAGRVEAFDLRPGDLVAPNQPVATILEPKELWVRVYVPETRLGQVSIQQRVAILVDSFPGRKFGGRVVEIRQRAEYLPRNVQTLDQRADQVFGVKVAIDDAPELKAGMAAFVELQTATAAGKATP